VGTVFSFGYNAVTRKPMAVPAGLTYVSASSSQGNCTYASGTVICDLGTLTNLTRATASIVVRPSVVGTVNNTIAVHAAVSSESGTMKIPHPNYFAPSSFGSLELRQRPSNEFIGQPIDYTNNTVLIRKMTLDELNLPRVDFIKIDIEGMEMEALAGARETIKKYRPILLIEKIKTDNRQLEQWLNDNGYRFMGLDINILAVHQSDECWKDINAPQSAGQPAEARALATMNV